MRTFSRADWEESQREWDEGEFGYKWQKLRRLAAERGFIYPPSGSKHDDRDAENPSQRAIIWRAMEDNPTELDRIMRRSRSWSHVVDGIIGLEARLRLDADDAAALDRWERDQDPTHKEAVASLGGIIRRIEDSL